ncbi:hypothetical protein [Nocardioides stalactiti]|uniref:hypothetical protein n=1 Tax=Nocardioides stalactiti TaxID=2755356 RepID=UPI0016030451|nr:hypothetical protein [Nocardioides stalactiti]
MSRARVLALVLPMTLAAGCSDDTAEPQSELTDELAAHDGRPCPDELPVGDDPDGYGFGTNEPAEERPSMLSPEKVWVCKYWAGGQSTGSHQTYRWQLEGEPRKVGEDVRGALIEFLDELEPAEEDRACTADLGPRWMVSYSHEGDLTGVVIDDFGCDEVRLTDEPFEKAPGDPDQEGTVPGVLAGPTRLLLAAVDAR